VSTTVMTCVALALFPHASVAVHVRPSPSTYASRYSYWDSYRLFAFLKNQPSGSDHRCLSL
jgi:hypothetical protein